MREYTKNPKRQSHTLNNNSKASRQAPIDVILQRYKERSIQRYPEDEELVQGKFNAAPYKEIEEDELLQGEFECTSKAEKDSVQHKEKQNNTGLPDNLKKGIENLSGYSMNDVKVHYNSDKPSQLQALAYTQGTDIHVAPRQEQYLPHEAWHVVQQKQGRVQPTVQLQGINVNDNEGLEEEADKMGGKAIQFRNKFHNENVQIENIGSVAQLAHIQDSTEPVLASEDSELDVESTKPTMVFESMSINKKDLKAIFEESKKYNGNTICVVGLNCKADKDLGELSVERDFTDANRNGHRHLFYYFTFRWTATSEDSSKNRGYPMPFVEARLEIMKKAKQVTDQITRQDKAAHKFLYRWIDGDARDDTSNDMNTRFLISIAKSEKEMIVTGKYDWRTENESGVNETSRNSQDVKKWSDFNNYKNFIADLNIIEKQLRKAYYLVGDKKTIVKLSRTDTSENEYLPGFYLPETSFIMNESAHNKATDNYEQFGSEPQDKESMKVAKMISPEYIVFHSGLSVSKPLKGENTGSSYLSEELKKWILKETTRAKPRDKKELITGLKNLRQSAFDNRHWFYINNSTWQEWETSGTPDEKKKDEVNQENFNDKRRELAEKLYEKYKNESMDIGQART